MKSTTLSFVVGIHAFFVLFVAGAFAQRNAGVDLHLPPVVVEAEAAFGSGSIKCSLAISVSEFGAIFGVSEIKGTSAPIEFLVSSQTSPYNVMRVDENCNVISSWTTASTASSLLGCAYDTTSTTTYWMTRNEVPKALVEFQLGTGVPTGRSVPISDTGVPAPLCTNDNTADPNDMAYEDIARDFVQVIDVSTGQLGCTFANPDDNGSGAFGNGLDDSVDTTVAEFVISSGSINEGQVVRAGEHDCNGNRPDTWNFFNSIIPLGATFPQGFSEFTGTGGDTCMMIADGATNLLFVILPSSGIADCQGVDSSGDRLITVNSSSGGTDFTQPINADAPLIFRIQRPAAGGSSEYVTYWNAGLPDSTTITTLPANLGPICFPMLGVRPPTESAIFNNARKEDRIGSSQYFGVPVANPPLAPATVRVNPAGDVANMPAGSSWTMQGIIYNPAASSEKGASVTNAIVVVMQ